MTIQEQSAELLQKFEQMALADAKSRTAEKQKTRPRFTASGYASMRRKEFVFTVTCHPAYKDTWTFSYHTADKFGSEYISRDAALKFLDEPVKKGSGL